jgi:hypothetical protein
MEFQPIVIASLFAEKNVKKKLLLVRKKRGNESGRKKEIFTFVEIHLKIIRWNKKFSRKTSGRKKI